MSSGLALEAEGGRWKRYPAYRDSGVEWVGAVPEGWRIMRAKYCSKINMGQSPSSEDCSINRIGLPFLQGNAEFGEFFPAPKHTCPNPPKIAYKGDILISVRAPVGALNIADQDYGIGRWLCAMTFRSILPRYGWWVMHNSRLQLSMLATGSTYEAVANEDVSNVVITFPDKITQNLITDYLDRETTRIDALVAEKQKMLALLEEKHAALISRAVTRGLNPDVPLKPSGLDWLGDIPEHWEVKPLKYYTSYNDEALANSTDKNYNLKYIDIGNVNSDGVINEIVEYKYQDAPSRARRIVKNGDVIISTVRTYLKAIAKIENDKDIIVSTGFAVLRPRSNIESDFLNLVVRANYFIEDVCANSFGVSYPAINASELVTLKLAVPTTIEEQKAIVKHIQTETTKIAKTIITIQKEIALVEEYKTALIAEAVTGKIDVRKWSEPLISTD